MIEKWLFADKSDWHFKTQILIPEKMKQDRSAILIHGFVGSPYDMKILGERLSKKGFRVIIPVMKGQTHATPLFERKKYTASYYIHSIRKMIKKESELTGKKPYLVGFSMGGTISTIIAKENTIKKLVLLAPFYQLPRIDDKVWDLSKWISPFLAFVPKISKGKINDKNGYRNYWPGSYLISLKAFGQLGILARTAKKCVDEILIETQVFISRQDQVASSKMTVELFKDKKNVKIHYVNRSNHILLYDYDADKIMDQILEFFTRGGS